MDTVEAIHHMFWGPRAVKTHGFALLECHRKRRLNVAYLKQGSTAKFERMVQPQ